MLGPVLMLSTWLSYATATQLPSAVLTVPLCGAGELNSAKATTQTHLMSESAASESASATALHPHLLFLKTGGGSTVSEPKHQLTMQELQTLADSGSTSEGLLPVQTKTPSPVTNTAAAKQQPQGPLGTANIVLSAQDESFQQLASLFTPQNDKAIAKALRILEDNDDEPVSQALFSSLVAEPEDDLLSAVSVPYDSLHQPFDDMPVRPGRPQTRQRDHEIKVDPMLSLSWLDEADLRDVSKTASVAQKKVLQASGTSAGDRPAPARSVLLSIALSIVSTNLTVRCKQPLLSSSLVLRPPAPPTIHFPPLSPACLYSHSPCQNFA